MRRQASTILAACVAWLFALVAGWCATSYVTSWEVRASSSDATWYVRADGGLVKIWRVRREGADLAAHPPFNRSADVAGFGVIYMRSKALSIGISELIDGDPFSATRPARYRYHSAPPPVAHLSRGITVPGWFLFCCFAVYPFAQVVCLRRHLRMVRRRERGLCVSCGYDLRVTPGRCPECGAVPAPTEAAA